MTREAQQMDNALRIVEAQMAELLAPPTQIWEAPLKNSWTAEASGETPGIVTSKVGSRTLAMMVGAIQNGTSGATLFTIPEDLRPKEDKAFICANAGTGGSGVFWRVLVYASTGIVVGSQSASGQTLYLNNILYFVKE